MPTVQIAAPSGFGGSIMGNFGNYVQGADGSFTVDARDAVTLLAQGFSFVKQVTGSYVFPAAPLVATVGKIVASAALANGVLSIANQPDVARPVRMRVDPGTSAVSAGTCTVVYTANDGSTQTDVLQVASAASVLLTTYLSKGAVAVTSVTLAAVAGGTSPKIQLDTGASVSVPVATNAIDFSVFTSTTDGTIDTTTSTVLTGVLGSVVPTTAPNGTHTYSFGFNTVSPNT